jgi:hypothetical protein
MVAIVDAQRRLKGIFTDGDLRRKLDTIPHAQERADRRRDDARTRARSGRKRSPQRPWS